MCCGFWGFATYRTGKVNFILIETGSLCLVYVGACEHLCLDHDIPYIIIGWSGHVPYCMTTAIMEGWYVSVREATESTHESLIKEVMKAMLSLPLATLNKTLLTTQYLTVN